MNTPRKVAIVTGSGTGVGAATALSLARLGYDDRLKAYAESSTPLGRVSTPQDVAEAIVWLLDGARTVTGELLHIDAGLHLGAAPQIRR